MTNKPARPLEFPRARRTNLTVETHFPRDAPLLEKLEYLTAIGGPIGLIPLIPATWASLLTAAAWHWLPNGPAVTGAAASALSLIGVRTASTAERLLQTADPRNVVIDELAGQTLTFLFVPPVNWRSAIAGFVLFRLFDVLKPYPARRAERLPAGWGVVTDDLIAGLYAALSLWLTRKWL